MAEQPYLDVSPIMNDASTSVSESNSKVFHDDCNYNYGDNDKTDDDDDVASNASDPIAEILYAQSSQTEQVTNDKSCDLKRCQKQNRYDSIRLFDERLQPLLKMLTNYLQLETEQIEERSLEERSEEQEKAEEEEQEQNFSIQNEENERATAISALFADLQSVIEEIHDNINTINTNGDVAAIDKTNSCSCAEISLLSHIHAIKCLMRELSNVRCESRTAQLEKINFELAQMHNILPDPVLRNLQTEIANFVEVDARTPSNLPHDTINEKLDTNLLHIMSLIGKYIVILQRELLNATKNLTQRASVITLHFK